MGFLEVRSRESSRQRKLTWSGEPPKNWWFHKGYEDTKRTKSVIISWAHLCCFVRLRLSVPCPGRSHS